LSQTGVSCRRLHIARFRSVGRGAIFGFVFLDPKNHKMHIAPLVRFRSVGRCAIFGFVFLGQKKSGCQPSANRPLFFDNLHFGQIAKRVNQQSRLTLLAICPKWRLSKKRGRFADGCKMHISPDSVRLVDVRYSVLYILAEKNHKIHSAHLSSVRVKGRRISSC